MKYIYCKIAIYIQLSFMIASSKADKTDHLKEYTHFNISHSNNEVLVSKFISLTSFLNASGNLNKNSYFIITIKYNID